MGYIEIKKKYLAESLSFLGFKYCKLNTNDGIFYSFYDTKEFREALQDMLRLKDKFRK